MIVAIHNSDLVRKNNSYIVNCWIVHSAVYYIGTIPTNILVVLRSSYKFKSGHIKL